MNEYQEFVQFVYLNFFQIKFFVEDEYEVMIDLNHLNKLVNIFELTNLNNKRISFLLIYLITYVVLCCYIKDYKEAKFYYQLMIK